MTEDDSPERRPRRAPSVSMGYVRGLTDYLTARSIQPPGAVAGWAALPRDGRIPMTDYASGMEQTAITVGDPDLGLHVGESIRLGHYGVLGYVAVSCSTLDQALQRYRRYQALAADVGQQVERQGELIRISWTPGGNLPHRQAAEANLAAWIGFARWITDRPLALSSVEFRHARPDDVSEHRRIFGREPRFGCPRHALSFDAAMLDLPLPQADAEMRALMDRHADQRLLRLSAGGTLAERVDAFILQHLASGRIGLEDAARALGLGARALQRRLAADGLRYREQVDACRRHQAGRYLEDPNIDLSELALLLGFSEQSAFQRAYRRWFGGTPAAHRRRQQQVATEGDC